MNIDQTKNLTLCKGEEGGRGGDEGGCGRAR